MAMATEPTPSSTTKTMTKANQKALSLNQEMTCRFSLVSVAGSIALAIVVLSVVNSKSDVLFTHDLSRVDATFEPARVIACSAAHESYNVNSTSYSTLGVYKRIAIAVDSEHCASVGKEILMRNGSAVDAAIATGLCNGLMNPQSAGIGGGHFMVIYLKQQNKTYVIDARETAPMNAYQSMYANRSSESGGLSTAIPGEIYGFWRAHQLAGRLPWRDLFQPAIDMCRRGFKVSRILARVLRTSEREVRANRALASIFVNKANSKNELYAQGETIKMPLLARTLKFLAESTNAIDAFYNSELSKLMVKEINENGGNVTRGDFAAYRAVVREAVDESINDELRLITAPVPSSGALVAFILRLMWGFRPDNSTLSGCNENDSALFHHRLVESFKHAFAHRSLIGDEPDNADIARVLADIANPAYVDYIRSRISDERTFEPSYYTNDTYKADHGTAHISVLADGDAVSLTHTINSYFGAKYAGKQSGIVYNNEMDDFSSPNQINLYNLEPSKANYIRPGKRPMSSMSPIIVVDKRTGQVRLILGGSGGSKILTAVAQTAIKSLWLGKNIKEAIDDARVHHQLFPDHLLFETFFDEKLVKQLTSLGHTLECFDIGGSNLQGIAQDVHTGEITANCDFRKEGVPDGL